VGPPDEELALPPEELLALPPELPPELLVVPPELLLLLLPPHGPQTPAVEPGAMMHELPGQQSALLVQAPHAATHDVDPQMNGGVPAGLGTHGMWLQQLALEAHEPPGLTHTAGEHRGTPTLSWWQVSIVSQLPAQQSHRALQLMVESLQTLPSG
jgi:hypothetical protein